MSSCAPPSPKRRKKDGVYSSSPVLPKAMRALSRDDDALRYLCSFLDPQAKSQTALNELRRPALMLDCCNHFYGFVEQASEAKTWKVTLYDYDLNIETSYHRQGSEPRNEFLWKLFYWIMGQRNSSTYYRFANVYFSEARSKAEYKCFLNEYKSVLMQWPKETFEHARERLKLAKSWDPLFRGCASDPQDYFLVLMQRKCGMSKLFLPSVTAKPTKRGRKELEQKREAFFASYDEFLRGDLCLQPLLEKKVKIYEKRHPFPMWRDMILSLHMKTRVVK